MSKHDVLERYGSNRGDQHPAKKCKVCGKPLKQDSRFETCFDCGRAQKTPAQGGSTTGLPANYVAKLNEGYFDSGGHLCEEFVTTMASEVALSMRSLKNHQLRRFYGHARAADNRLKKTGDWDAVNLDVKTLLPFASEAKGKDKIPVAFYEFIERNIKAIRTRKDFENGFMEHFQAVVAYFTYHYPRA
jgi:CRISPR type III-A-associated protein Csm2